MVTSKIFAGKAASARTALVRSRMKETIALWGMAGLLFSTACLAQVLKGAQAQPGSLNPGGAPESAAKFHQRLLSACKSGKMQCVGRTSPKIANLRAGEFVDLHLGVLRNQKQNADREAQEMQRLFGNPIYTPAAKGGVGVPVTKSADAKGTAKPGIVNPGTSAVPGHGGSRVATTTGQNATAAIVQRTGAPQGPMQTESASGSPSPGSPAQAQANLAVQPCPQPTISTISGYPTVMFTPILFFNPYTIKGCGFGSQMGNVYLTGAFNAGKIPLRVQTSGGSRRAPARASWSDTAIIVSVDPKLSGELNQENVTLVVEPVGGAPIQKAGNKFLAFYEDVTLQTIPQSAVTFFDAISASVGGKTTTKTVNSGSVAMLSVTSPDLEYYTPSQVPAGESAEVFRAGKTNAFFSAGSDLFDFSGLSGSFQPESFQLYAGADPTGCDQGTGGSQGSWNAKWEGHNIRVTWKEFQCHNMWTGNLPEVWSSYALSVVVKGPRGIDPWTGTRLLSVRAFPR